VLKYLETNLTHQNSIEEEIKSRLKSGNTAIIRCRIFLFYGLLSKNTKIKIYRTIFFLLFCMGVKLGRSR